MIEIFLILLVAALLFASNRVRPDLLALLTWLVALVLIPQLFPF